MILHVVLPMYIKYHVFLSLCRFTNAVCKFPGSTHDAYILSSSSLPECISNLTAGGWLLGDSGYPLKEWLMTPIYNPKTGQEERYNSAHCRTRNVVERAFGVLKARFRYMQAFFLQEISVLYYSIYLKT